MPRRPNTKNIPSRLFEESATPIYIVDSQFKIIYANPALAALLKIERDSIVRLKLHYIADQQQSGPQNLANRLCPPPTVLDLHRSNSTSASAGTSFRVHLDADSCFECHCQLLRMESENVIMCELQVAPLELTSPRIDQQWLHERIQKFRSSQQQLSNAIPFLGDSPVAKRCFAQARAFALLQSHVLVVGHPQSQIVEIAKSIHHSGFSDVDQPDPLLPINCEQVDGSRIKEILAGHLQVVQPVEGVKRIFVLLINADQLDAVGQRALLESTPTDFLRFRFISTAKQSLVEVDGFDAELANRLSTLELKVPPLSDRTEDIPVLAQTILEALGNDYKPLSHESLQNLQLYSWKSDYQELKVILEEASRNANGDEIREADFPHHFQMALKALAQPRRQFEPIDLDQVLSEIELEAIQTAIAAANGNKTNAARLLGITRARLHRKLAEQGHDAGTDDK